MNAPASFAVESSLEGVLSRFVGPVIAKAVLQCGVQRLAGGRAELAQKGLTPDLLAALLRGLAVFCHDKKAQDECATALRALASTPLKEPESVVVPIGTEDDVVKARSAARVLAMSIGFDQIDQVRLVTAVSELARNIFRYAKVGRIRLKATQPRAGLAIEAEDEGPGITGLDDILGGRYVSKSGMGLGLKGCKQLMDAFSVQCPPARPRGTLVCATKFVR
jgi:serine/threonine-protein kinase RsbT